MSGYDFLKGLLVLDVSQLGPGSLGGYLADMGADVIKVEGADGDPVRYSGAQAMGTPDGPSLLHLRWNRGKRSLGLDLKSAEGAALFRQLASRAAVVIEGMRAGVLERLGLGAEQLRQANPALVFCSISGLGSYGPYHRLGSHGPSFDAFAGLSSANPYALHPSQQQPAGAPVGMHAMGLYAAIGVLSALLRARRTGQGAALEVAAADAAAHWRPDGVDTALNAEQCHTRPGFFGAQQRMAGWPRLWHYATADGKAVFFQGLSTKFWERFCTVLERPDLIELYRSREVNEADALTHPQLEQLFATRTQAAWMEFFLAHDVPGSPANDLHTLAEDPHFLARDNLYEVALPEGTGLRLTGTPVKVDGQGFAPSLAPQLGADTDTVLAGDLGLGAAAIEDLRRRGVVF